MVHACPSRNSFLSPEALDGVLQFCREATVFFDVKIGYLGAYFNDGLSRCANNSAQLPSRYPPSFSTLPHTCFRAEGSGLLDLRSILGACIVHGFPLFSCTPPPLQNCILPSSFTGRFALLAVIRRAEVETLNIMFHPTWLVLPFLWPKHIFMIPTCCWYAIKKGQIHPSLPRASTISATKKIVIDALVGTGRSFTARGWFR